ncbi:ATP-binding protein [Luteirhabdus pelagi]|uniref:ATP-binding protein n=1 Tax=Luteirhabdus pelagi TaxID=2792783 RepID=UPI0019398B34|nr:tetratricopeptide repeat protein [Luteirhabdus pelagi]
MKYKLLLCTLVLATFFARAQSVQQQIDSLMQLAEKSNDSAKLRIYNRVSFYYIFNDKPKAKELLTKGLRLSKERNVPFSETEITNTYGILMDVSGKADSARIYFEKALDLSNARKYDNIKVMAINNLGMYHWNRGEYETALDYFFQALDFSRSKKGDWGNDAVYLNNIGLIYQEMGQWDKALQYHDEAYKYRKENNVINEIPISLNNMAIVYKEKGDLTLAEKTAKEAIDAAEFANETQTVYNAMNTLANVYVKKEEANKAIPLLEEIISGRNKTNIDRRSNLSAISTIINLYNQNGNLEAARSYVKQGEALLQEFSLTGNAVAGFYRDAAETNYRSSNINAGNEYLERYESLRDSIYSSESAEKLAALETKYNVAEKERDLAQTRANLAEKDLEVRRKNTLLYGSFGLALLLALIGYLVYSQQKLKNRQLQKESELRSALARIETQNKLQEQRLRISRDLHDNIGAQLTFIISSIDNLKYGLKDASKPVLEKLSGISQFTTQTIYELRDTIWAMNKEKITAEDLQGRISNFMEKARVASEDVNFNFNISEEIATETTFSSVQGMNVYRIIQESVNNALKYAEANNINVRITSENKSIITKIEDDGKGFSTTEVAGGNGLNNIKKRAHDLGGEATISSSPETGTKVEVTFPKPE